MTLDPVTVRAGSTLEEVAERLSARRVSALPVVSEKGRIVGVISRRDLLEVGHLEIPEGRKVPEWRLPDQTAESIMKREILAVAPSTSMSEAAALMLDHRVHRVFIEKDGQLRGVLTTRDVMQAIVDVHLSSPIEGFMSKPAQTISHVAPLGTALRQLEELSVRGLIVLDDDGHPVGFLSEEEALAARHHDPSSRVETVMGHELLLAAEGMPVHRAAAKMATMHGRRMVVMRGDEILGVLTGFDLAGAATLAGTGTVPR